MVDLMIWMIIAALIATYAIQAISQYRSAAIVYQMKSDLKGAADLALSRAVLTGFVTEDEVAYSVDNSSKSKGVAMSWGKFKVQDDAPNYTDDPASAQALGDSPFLERVSVQTSTSMQLASDVSSAEGPAPTATTDVVVDKTFVLVARHDEAPDIRVMYFFGDIFVYNEGTQDFPVDALPPIQDKPSVEEVAPTQPTEPVVTPTPTPSPSPSTETPSTEPTPEPTPTSTEEPVEPVGSTDPQPVETAAPSPDPEPEPSPAPSNDEDLTPEPDPLTPADNMDPKTKKFLFCHGGSMHSNSYKGMIEGHEHHVEDIMPPIPPINYPGYNWNYRTAKTYYNNCVPPAA